MNVLATRGYLLAIAAGVLFGGTGAAAESDNKQSPTQIGLRSIPILYVKTTSKKRCKFAFRNETGHPFRYMPGLGGRDSSAHLKLFLSQNGKRLRKNAPFPKPPSILKRLVQTLKPGEKLEGELILGHYDRLKPGRYEI